MVSTKKKSIRQEKRLGKVHKIKQIPASGAIRFGGADYKREDVIVESKATDNNFYNIKNQDLNKLYKLSGTRSRNPVFIVQFLETKFFFVPTFDTPTIIVEEKTYRISEPDLKISLASGNKVVLKFKDEVIQWKITLDSPL